MSNSDLWSRRYEFPTFEYFSKKQLRDLDSAHRSFAEVSSELEKKRSRRQMMAEWQRGGRGELERCRGEIFLVLGRGREAAGVPKTGKSRRAIPLGIERYREGFSGRGMRAARRT